MMERVEVTGDGYGRSPAYGEVPDTRNRHPASGIDPETEKSRTAETKRAWRIRQALVVWLRGQDLNL